MTSCITTTISPHDLARRLREPNPPLLLDCREADEWQFCRIEGARHMPMSEIRTRIHELDRGQEIVVYCHHGVRSLKVVEFLSQQGFSRLANLAGGIDAWSLCADSRVPRY
jgi:rhodanese-related sulfurtransferase